ncbi:hypothetical protein KIN20_011927 [Parelaphostrongylus tenuis]|uniref:Uncharacterized protein n=1 Tax=Parelaphostrongylus tenuis TaxID=148309 RepID=A0AAD5MW49_PARTN|nr:hypothetical protein KIN20_011927 [Parelaphostrongylus tenuis]
MRVDKFGSIIRVNQPIGRRHADISPAQQTRGRWAERRPSADRDGGEWSVHLRRLIIILVVVLNVAFLRYQLFLVNIDSSPWFLILPTLDRISIV